MCYRTFTISVLLLLSVVVADAPKSPLLPLPTLIPYFKSEARRELDEVFVSYGGSRRGYAIGDYDDRSVKHTRRKSEDQIYKEFSTQARHLSTFEAEQLTRVCDGFAKALEILEHDLHRERFDRLTALDNRMCWFLYGFYYLISAAYCSRSALPLLARIPVTHCDNSSHCRQRIETWKTIPDHCLKLRITTKELVHQLEKYQRTHLRKRHKGILLESNSKFSQTYTLFIKIYFDLH
jgi:hypothetical protein